MRAHQFLRQGAAIQCRLNIIFAPTHEHSLSVDVRRLHFTGGLFVQRMFKSQVALSFDLMDRTHAKRTRKHRREEG